MVNNYYIKFYLRNILILIYYPINPNNPFTNLIQNPTTYF